MDSSQFVYYILDQNNMVQVDNIIFRPIEDTVYDVKWKFLLTTTAANLSTSTYEYMSDGIFNTQVMNKFATNQDLDFDLFEFVKNTPNGYEETQNNMEQALKPPFRWGPWVNTSCTRMSQDRWIDMTGDGEPDPTYNSPQKKTLYISDWI